MITREEGTSGAKGAGETGAAGAAATTTEPFLMNG